MTPTLPPVSFVFFFKLNRRRQLTRIMINTAYQTGAGFLPIISC